MNWESDRRLQLQMGLSFASLVLTVLAAALATGVAIALASSVPLAMAFGAILSLKPYPVSPDTPLLAAILVIVSALGVLSLVLRGERDAPAHAASVLGAREVSGEEYPEFANLVTRVSGQADTPVPALSLAPTDTPLSLTTGYTPTSARLIVSEGLLELLDSDELEAVVAHELAHVKNRDVAVMTAAALPIGAARRVIELLSGPTAGIEHGQVSRADYTDALLTVGLLLVFPIWICAHLLSTTLSRAREFAADRGAVAITGDPAALAAALEKIDSDLEDRPQTDFRQSNVAAFAIVEPSRVEYDGVLAGVRRQIRGILATHPPTNTRLDRLRELVEAHESTQGTH